MSSWQPALEKVIPLIYDLLDHDKHRWVVVGSTASALQEAEITPGDIDILPFTPEGTCPFAERMRDFAPPTCEFPMGDDNWYSSTKDPIATYEEYGFHWHFGRWTVEGVEVETAYIQPPDGHPTSANGIGIWEAGSEIWPHVRRVAFAGYELPVVPLEIQLQTNWDRGRIERADAILAVFRSHGYDRNLIKQALSADHLKKFDEVI